ncbi:MAG: aldehyde dehydrogenase family protein, partial [Steroidobacteraceae bacterium]
MSIQCVSPVDGKVYAERTAATPAQVDEALRRARAAQRPWRQAPLPERAALIERFCAEFERRGAEIATGLSWQIGRPIRFAPSEVRGTLERARYMTGIAAAALADVDAGPKPGLRRFIRREPLGVVFSVAAWNYPYLIAVNSVVPA